jgi:sugar lactone lactonase YvrE
VKPFILAIALLLAVYPARAKPEVEILYDGDDGLNNPFGIAFDQQQRMIICEYLGGRLWRTTPDHHLERIAGTEAKGYAGDGGPLAEAIFNGMHNVAFDAKGQLFISDTRNNRIRSVDPQSGLINTLAGTDKKGFNGDGIPANEAQLADPISISMHPEGHQLLIADLQNRRVRMVDLANGLIQTLAGNGQRGVPKDGALALESPLVDPRGVAADQNGNLYILERNGHALRVVREGRITTIAGTGQAHAGDGPALEAGLNGPKHLCIDIDGSVIIADAENHLIKRYDPKRKTLETILGKGDTKLKRPHGVWVDAEGVLYVCDSWNDRVLRVNRTAYNK